MKFKIDENLPVEVAELLRKAGYDAVTVVEQKLGGEADGTIAAICRIEQRIIITLILILLTFVPTRRLPMLA